MPVGREMPRYKCHKEVWALKIDRVEHFNSGDAVIHPAEEGYGPIHITSSFIAKHDPQPGAYYVVYKDGYASISPAQAFEDGYTRI